MATKLIGLSGYAQSGKDTTAKILIDNYGFTRVSFADALRDSLYALNPYVLGQGPEGGLELQCVKAVVDRIGWDRSKTEYSDIRQMLQLLGTEVGRNILGENIWVDIAMRKVDAIDGPVVITDMRFMNELQAITTHNGETWRIIRPGFGPVNNHPSETALDNVAFDVYINNDGTLFDLTKIVDEEIAP